MKRAYNTLGFGFRAPGSNRCIRADRLSGSNVDIGACAGDIFRTEGSGTRRLVQGLRHLHDWVAVEYGYVAHNKAAIV